jgi:uncharacterized protein (DUF1697 family)
MNAKMPELKRCFEQAGFLDVVTVLSSGNVVFSAVGAASDAALQDKVEAAMQKRLDRGFLTVVRSVDKLRRIIDADPYQEFPAASGAKRVVTFLRARPGGKSKTKLSLPIEVDGARILCVRGGEIFTDYVPSPRGAVFMTLIEKTFGKAITTRTWETIKKVAAR